MKTDINLANLLAPHIKTLQRIDLPQAWCQQVPEHVRCFVADKQPKRLSDCLLWHQGLKRYSALDYFNQAYDSLPMEGQLICVDSLHRHPQKRPYRPYVLEQAKRCGFKLTAEYDTGKKNILVFKKHKQLRWRTQWLAIEQQQAMRDLFKQVFQEAMDSKLWHWKYGDGRGVAIGIWQQDSLVAHYGGMYKRLYYFGKKIKGMQVGDVMVAPQERARLTRQGPFYLSATCFAEQYLGYGNPALVAYGFPNARAIKIAQRLGVYQAVDNIIELRWQAGDSNVVGSIFGWKKKPRWQRRLAYNYLWRQMRFEQQAHIIGIRDWAYLRHRYREHPQKKYELFWYQQGAFPKALLVIHKGTDQCRLMDYIGSQKYTRSALNALSQYLSEQGISEYRGWFSRCAADKLGKSHASEHETEIVIPTSSWSKGPGVQDLKGHWWLTTGDTDFL